MKLVLKKTLTSPLAISLLLAVLIMLGSFGFLAQYTAAQNNMEGNGGNEPTATCIQQPYGCGPGGDYTCYEEEYTEAYACGPQGDNTCYRLCGPSLVPAINGVCDGSHYSCTTGTSINNIQNDSTWQWTWTCAGANNGTNASCSEARPNQAPFVFAGVDITLRQPATSVTVGDAQAFDR